MKKETVQYPLLHQPRPWNRIHVGTAPGGDARWRGVPAKVRKVDGLRRREQQQRNRGK